MTEEEYLNLDKEDVDWDGNPIPGWDRERKVKFLKKLTPEVKDMFLRHPSSIEHVTSEEVESGHGNNYYVYVQRTVDDHRIFYVGIHYDPDYEYTTRIDKRVVMLEKEKGIELVKVICGLTALQATVYCDCYMRELIEKGEYLLNYQFLAYGGNNCDITCNLIGNEPSFVFRDGFIKRYFPSIYESDILLDTPTVDDMSVVTFYSKQNAKIVEWLSKANAKVTKSVGKGTKTVVVDNWIPYFDYLKIKEEGKLICGVEDVLKLIENVEPTGLFGKKKLKKVPKYNHDERNRIRDFLKKYDSVCDSFYKYMKKNRFPLELWANPFLFDGFGGEEPDKDIWGTTKFAIIYKIIVFENPRGSRYVDELIKHYKKIGLFAETVTVLSKLDGYSAELQKAKEYAENDIE